MSEPHPKGHLSAVARPILYSLLLILVFFSAYTVVEHLWLKDLEMETLHKVHLLRGLLGSLIAASVAGWLIAKSGPSLYRSEGGTLQPPPDETERTQAYAGWLVQMRWVAVVVAATLIVGAVWVADVLPHGVIAPMLLMVGVLAATNLWFRHRIRAGRAGKAVLASQVFSDLFILTVLLHFSGGIENPLSLLMLLLVVIGGILLTPIQCYALALTGALLFAIMAGMEWAGLVSHYTIQIFPHGEGEYFHAAHHSLYVASRVGLHGMVLMLTAFFVTTVANHARENERKLEEFADRALADRKLLVEALETTETGLRVLDRNLEPYWVNNRWRDWFDETPCEEGGRAEELGRVLAEGERRVSECVSSLRRDQEPWERRTFQVTTAPVRGREGSVERVVELVQDVTRQKKAQQQMVRAGQLAAVGELAGHIAHEVNNPIAIISTKGRVLLSDRSDEMSMGVSREIEKVVELADRVARIAETLLTYVRPSEIKCSNVDVRIPIRCALEMVEQKARKQSVHIVEDYPEDACLSLASRDSLEQVFLNLFLNALDAMPQGGTLHIKVGLGESGKEVLVSIGDTGAGIPRDIRPHVFETFFTTKPKGKGTGLGLSISHSLVEAQGGRLDFRSGAEGTCFFLNLPLASAAVV